MHIFLPHLPAVPLHHFQAGGHREIRCRLCSGGNLYCSSFAVSVLTYFPRYFCPLWRQKQEHVAWLEMAVGCVTGAPYPPGPSAAGRGTALPPLPHSFTSEATAQAQNLAGCLDGPGLPHGGGKDLAQCPSLSWLGHREGALRSGCMRGCPPSVRSSNTGGS